MNFELTNEDRLAIDIASNMAHRFLRTKGIMPRQIIGLGNALYALVRLPLSTTGVSCEFGITYEAGNEDFRETRYYNFRIDDDSFSISAGGSVFDKATGGDRFSEPGWLIEAGGYREAECDLYQLERGIEEYLNLGAEITVFDESAIDYDFEDAEAEKERVSSTIVHMLKDRETPEQIQWMVQELPKAECLSEQDRTLLPILSKLYGILSRQLSLTCEKMTYAMQQEKWEDSAPLEVMAEVYPGIEDTKWYQGHLGQMTMPTGNPLFHIGLD